MAGQVPSMTRTAPVFTAAKARRRPVLADGDGGARSDGRHAAGPDQHVGLEAQSRYPDQMQVARPGAISRRTAAMAQPL